MKAALPKDEAGRLEALYKYQILDTEPEAGFDDLTNLAAYICNTPIALISLIDRDRQWFKSKVGLSASETHRDLAFCAHAILEKKPLIVPNALEDRRFATNILVTGDPNIRFYAGVPLVTSQGYCLGTLCAIDRIPRQLSSNQIKALEALSRQVVSQLELRLNLAQRQRTELVLRVALSKNLQLAQAIASTSQGVVITNPNQPNSPIIYTNPAFSRITGYEQAEVLGRSCRFLQGAGTDPETLAQIRQAIAERREVTATLLNYRKDGQPFWNELKISPVFSPKGELLYFVGLQTDVTEGKQAEETLKQQKELLHRTQERLQHLLTTSPAVIYSCKPVDDYAATFVSENVTALFGYKAQEFLAPGFWLNRIHPEDVPYTFAKLRRLFEVGHIAYEYRFRHIDGSYRWTYDELKLVRDSAGNPMEIVGSWQDITDRKQAEEEIRQTRNFLQTMIDHLPVAVFVKDSKKENFGVFKLWNKTCERIFGLTAEEAIGKTDYDRFPKEQADFFAQKDREVFESGIPEDILEEPIDSRTLGRRILHTVKVPIFDENHNPEYLLCISEDITERKIAEAALRESERKYQTLAEVSPVGIFRTDAAGNCLYVNERWCEIAGLTPEEAQGRGWLKAIHPEDRERVAREWYEAVQQNLVFSLEYRFQRPDGVVSWMFGQAAAELGEAEEVLGYVGTITDISDRVRVEKSLRESEERFRLVIDGVKDYAIFMLDPDGRVVSWNAGSEAIKGYQADEILGQHLSIFYTPEDIERGKPDRELQLVAETGRVEDEGWRIRKDGSLFWADVVITALRDETGKLKGFCKVTQDITDRKLAEEKIRKQAMLLDKSQDAILVLDTEDRILFWNQSAERLLGWTASEAIGKYASEFLFEFSPQLETASRAVTDRGEWNGELHQVTKEGKEITVESRWTLVRSQEDKSESILIVNTDITEKKLLERQFLRAQRMESIGTLASGIAHDLNNVLAPIMMAAQLLRIQLSDKQSEQWLNMVEASAKRGADLVKQVLSFARGIEGDRVTLQAKHLIYEIKQIIEETFPKSIALRVDVSSDLWTVCGDTTQLHQVLMNLCVNARDAMPNGGILNISAENLAIDENYARMQMDAKPGSYVKITVSDTGTGIPAEILDRIFEPFFTTKEFGKGTGMGLSTVMGIVKSHGGFINVASQIGKGTEFKVYLPSAEKPEVQSTEDANLPRGHGELILVVDDEASIREITKASLESHGYTVLTANDGVEAIVLQAKHQQEIKLALVDMMMPGMDGANTMSVMQKINPQIKIVAFSGLLSNDKLSESDVKNFQAFLSKPFTAKELLTTLHKVINTL